MGQAISYAYPLWPKMKACLKDGNIKIDNNLAENTIRPLTLSALCWHYRVKYCKSIYKNFFHYIKLCIFLWDLKWNHKQYAGIII